MLSKRVARHVWAAVPLQPRNGVEDQWVRSCLWARVGANSESIPIGPRTLCNACGLVYAKIIRLFFNSLSFSLLKNNDNNN
jgi:hypothetical protein